MYELLTNVSSISYSTKTIAIIVISMMAISCFCVIYHSVDNQDIFIVTFTVAFIRSETL